MKKTQELLDLNYQVHKEKKAKQKKNKQRKAAARKKKLENLVGFCQTCNCIPCSCRQESY